MLEELIRVIQTRGTVQPAELASILQTSPVLVQMMLENLERIGKLARVETACDTSCGGCPVANMCVTQSESKGRVWKLM